MTEEKLASILAKQVPDAEKRRLADFIVDTGQGLEAARARVDVIIKELSGDKAAEPGQ
jgi:dephospho-CoA kinase